MTNRSILCFVLAGTLACAPTVNEKTRVKAKIHYDIGVAEMTQANMRGALRELLTAVELDPDLAVAHNALGFVYHSMGRLDESLSHYEKAVLENPKFSEAHNNMGIVLTDLGRYPAAIASFKTALADILYATPSLAEGNMGWAFYKKGDIETGLKHLRNAVATNPKFCRGYLWLARVGLDQKEPDEAVGSYGRFEKYCLADEKLKRYISVEHVREMRYYLALGYLEKGLRTEARDALSQCADSAAMAGFGAKCAESLASLE